MPIAIRFDKQKIIDNLLGTIATGLFTGFVPIMPGTAASLAGAGLWWGLAPRSLIGQLSILALVLFSGWYSSRVAQDWWGQEDRRIVAADLAGMCLALFGVPKHLGLWITAFILYRLLDQVKFYPAQYCRQLDPAMGPLAEKSVTAVYTGVLLMVASFFFGRIPDWNLLLARGALYLSLLITAIISTLYGSFRVGVIAPLVSLGCLLFWAGAPGSPWAQAWLLVVFAIVLLAAVRFLAGLPWALTILEYFIVIWASWACLWFIPKYPLAIIMGGMLLVFFKLVRPYPTNYLPNWGLGASILLPNIIASIYTASIIQVGVLIFGRGDVVFINYIVGRILNLFMP